MIASIKHAINLCVHYAASTAHDPNECFRSIVEHCLSGIFLLSFRNNADVLMPRRMQHQANYPHFPQRDVVFDSTEPTFDKVLQQSTIVMLRGVRGCDRSRHRRSAPQ